MTQTQQIKVPQRSPDSRVEKALAAVPNLRDGQWHRLLVMGFTSAEQTARSLNGGPYEYGYTHELEGDKLKSVLWVRCSE